MAAINYYAGLQRGAPQNKDLVTAGASTAGASVDVEVRMQINNGSANTGLTRAETVILLQQLIDYVESGGIGGAGANLPAL